MKTILLGLASVVAGAAIVLAAVAGSEPVFAGLSTSTPLPTSTPDPTPDPCDQFKKLPATCVAGPTQPPRSEGQDTPTPTNTAVVTSVPQTPGATNTAAPPPPATATPGGGAGAGGVSPPDTGSGPGDAGLSWLVLGGVALAVAGGATLVQGVRRGR